MKKSYTSTDINQNQGQELSKKLYRSISEQAKRLDDARSCARTVGDLFSPNLLVLRKKFCEYCERLIFSEPTLYGRKGEELLWRKGYYDVVSTAKKLKKKEYLPEEISYITAHINAGIGFYNHMLSKLQYQFNLNIKQCIDFAVIHLANNTGDVKPETIDWANQSVHQCLIYLGDLSRYKLEIYPNWESALASRYYLQAISYKPEYGMPHNQMGTLAMNQNRFLEAVYHYMRCLACKYSFDGTSNNLIALFERNSKFIEQLPNEDQNADCIIEPEQSEKIKRFIARFLLLIDIWYFNKKVPKVYDLCHQTFKNLEECLTFTKVTNSESGDVPTDGDSVESESQTTHLSGDTIFRIVAICLLCISKLQSTKSSQISTAVAFTLGIYSQLLKNVSNHIQDGILNFPLNENIKGKSSNGILKDLFNGKKRSRSKLRRRKALKNESDDESEASEHEDDISSSDDSFISDNEDVLDLSSDEESDIIKVSDESNCGTPKDALANGLPNGIKTPVQLNPEKTKEDFIKSVQFMDVNDILEIVTEESTLQSIKIIHDWLSTDLEVLKSCGSNTGSLLRQITYLLNLVNINLGSPKMIGVGIKTSEIVNKGDKIPLTEDIVLKGMDILKGSQNNLNWNYIDKKSLSLKEEAVIRVVKLTSFGKFLTTVTETGISYDDENNIFVCALKENVDDAENSKMLMDEFDLQDSLAATTTLNGTAKSTLPPNLDDDSSSRSTNDDGGQLNKMKHMGQLWLAAEVRALESRVGAGRTALSPYLVLDADALIKYTFMVKQLVHSRKFIVLVPTAVVSALDDLKREKIEARDAIRWLESQFHRGNRFFRAQRPQERAPIPFIKYPKKKDKEMHIYIQIIECCHFLAEQQKGASNVVTLLIGNQNVLSNGENKEFSYVGLAQSVGIAIESITSFYGKWKKSKGKR